MDITFADGANSIVSGVAGTFVSGYTGVELTAVSDDSAIPLATYDSTGEVAVAVVENGKTKSIFYGSTSLPNKILRAFAAYAGATVYMNTEDTFYTDGYLAVVHAKTSGEKTIRFPKKCDVYDYFKGVWYTDVTKITVDVSRNVTRYFFYGSKEIMQKCGIG